MVCVSIAHSRHAMVLKDMKQAAEKADLVELRLDYLARDPDFKRLLADRPCPIIATCRRSQDGGRFNGSEDKRLAILRQAILEGVDYVDLEMDIAGKVPRYGKTKRIVSYHNMQETPLDLSDIYDEIKELDPDVIKIATLARRAADNVDVVKLIGRSSTPTLALCMGEVGAPTRILARKFGAPWTYACMDADRPVAPGQLGLCELLDVYRYRSIGKNTEVYGLIANPVAHSMSPLMHNAAFAEMGMDKVYVPFCTPDVDGFLETMDAWDVKGYSVTIPHKQAILRGLQQAEGVVKKLRACNTVIKRDGKFTGYNTDWRAAIDSLEKAMPPTESGDSPLKGRMVLLVGAGGVGRALGYALVSRGALLTIANRTEDKARDLARLLNCRCVPLEGVNQVLADVLVNATSVGMYPDVAKMVVHPSFLKPNMVVFDTVYNPEVTRLIDEAGARDCKTVSGLEMFVRQGAAQFMLFTGQPAPVDLIRDLVRRRLADMAQDASPFADRP